ncbi:MAG: transcriptional regulator [Burkholderiales bacterium]|nr:MAG: transcriptional regulator [Burkholderiales bacterium]
MTELVFEPYCLLPNERKLLRNGQALAVGARAFDVLCLLAGRAGDLVTKAEIFEKVWPGLVVEENNLQVHVSSLRKLLGGGTIATVPGRGYRFTAAVRSAKASQLESREPITSNDSHNTSSRSLAVMPFKNWHTDPDQEYFSDGLAEDIIAKLTRSPWLHVIARNSSFAMRAAHREGQNVCQALGTRYLVTGSVRRNAEHIRIQAELSDGVLQTSLWSAQFDRPFQDWLAIQEEIAAAIVSAVEPVALRREEQRTQQLAAPDMRSWEWLMRARWHFWRSTREHITQAQKCLDNALAITPHDSASLALMAFTHMSRVWAGWAEDARAEITQAQKLALKAVRENDQDANAHFTLGTALSFTLDFDQAIAELDYAVKLYPEFAAAAGELGRILMFCGRTLEAAEYVLQAIDASPQDPHLSLWIRTRALACYIDGDYAQAKRYALEATAKRPNWFFNHILCAAIHAACDDLAAARRSLDQSQAYGAYSLATLKLGHPFKDRAMLEKFTGHLKLAGWVG